MDFVMKFSYMYITYFDHIYPPCSSLSSIIPLLLLKIPVSTSPPFIFMFWFGKVISIFILNDPTCVFRVA